MKILTLVQYYLPGDRSGGPVRSVANLVEALGGEHEFLVLTRDRDQGDTAPYPDVRVNEWQPVGRARVFYASPDRLRWGSLRALLADTPHDLLYLISLFNARFTLAPLLMRRIGAIPRRPTIVSPKGELGAGALARRAGKKQAFLAAARALGLYRDVTWQASVPEERDEIAQHFGRSEAGGLPPIVVASDLPTPMPRPPQRDPKRPGELRVAFASRIDEKKNLAFVIETLGQAGGPVALDIYGPVEHDDYWRRCRASIEALPPNVRAVWHGPVPHQSIPSVLGAADLFFLPTLGENYGHVILESLAAGCPVLISDRTPWRDLEEAGAGWSLKLDEPAGFLDVVRKVQAMNEDRHATLRRAARSYADAVVAGSEPSVEQHRQLFRAAL